MNKNAITILILLLAIIAVIFGLMIPFYNQVRGTKNELEKNQKIFIETEETVELIKQLAPKYEAALKEFNQIDSVLPDEEDFSGLIVNFEDMALKGGIFLESIAFQPGTPRSTATEKPLGLIFKTVGLQLRAMGTYESSKNFIKAIEKNIRLMDIGNIKLNTQERKEGFDINIGLGTYYETPVKKLVKAIYLKEIKLDTAFLKTEKFKVLRSFGELPIKIGEKGRINPFSAY